MEIILFYFYFSQQIIVIILHNFIYGLDKFYFNLTAQSFQIIKRFYQRYEKLYPKIIQIFRLGLGQVPVNFSPRITIGLLEEFLNDDYGNKKYNVFDMCSGWGGRLLGCLSSKRKIHYIGTDVNSNNFGCYERLGEFFQSSYFNNRGVTCGNTFDIFRKGSEVIRKDPKFQQYKGKIDLCLTSPPYFSREMYSDDAEQSYKKFPNYQDWLEGFLRKTIQNCAYGLKPKRHLIINIANVSSFDTLEEETGNIILSEGFEYIDTFQLTLSKMPGKNLSGAKKFEPVFLFRKK